MEQVALIHYRGILLDVWNTLDEPYFLARDIGELVYGDMNSKTTALLRMVSPRNMKTLQVSMSGRRRRMRFINEAGLNEAFARSYLPQAIMWFKIITKELVRLRKQQELNILNFWGDWDHRVDNEWYDYENDIWYDIKMDHHGDPYLVERPQQ